MQLRRSLAMTSLLCCCQLAAGAAAGPGLPALAAASVASEVPGGRSELRLSFAEAERRWRERSRELRLAEAAVSGAEADLRSADRAPNPQASLNLASISPQEGFGAGSLRDKRMDSILRVEQVFERGGKRELRRQAADAMLQAVRDDRDDVARQQLRALARAYHELLFAQEAEGIAADTAALYRRSVATSELRHRAGDISGADLSRLRVEQQRAENDARQAQAVSMRARVALAYLIGEEGNAARLVASDGWPAPGEGADAGTADPAQRADVRAALARLEAAGKARDLARSLKTRDLSLGLQFERNQQSLPGNSFGVGVSAPLFVNHEYEGEIARAEADLQMARESLGQTRAQAQGEIEQAAADLAASRERRLRLEGGLLADAERVVRAAEFAYARGASSLLELLDARRTWQQVQLEAANARADHARALAAWRAASAQ